VDHRKRGYAIALMEAAEFAVFSKLEYSVFDLFITGHM
jgi:hypothetical protein